MALRAEHDGADRQPSTKLSKQQAVFKRSSSLAPRLGRDRQWLYTQNIGQNMTVLNPYLCLDVPSPTHLSPMRSPLALTPNQPDYSTCSRNSSQTTHTTGNQAIHLLAPCVPLSTHSLHSKTTYTELAYPQTTLASNQACLPAYPRIHPVRRSHKITHDALIPWVPGSLQATTIIQTLAGPKVVLWLSISLPKVGILRLAFWKGICIRLVIHLHVKSF